MVDTLEAEFAAGLGRRYALGTASGTAALSCAFAALKSVRAMRCSFPATCG